MRVYVTFLQGNLLKVMNKEILIWVLGIEDCHRSKEGHGHKGRYVGGQAPEKMWLWKEEWRAA